MSYISQAGIRTITASYTVVASDSIILCNQGAAIQINLPVTNPGKSYTIIDISNGALTNPVTISGVGCSINGGLTTTLGVNRGETVLYSDGANYYKGTSVL